MVRSLYLAVQEGSIVFVFLPEEAHIFPGGFQGSSGFPLRHSGLRIRGVWFRATLSSIPI